MPRITQVKPATGAEPDDRLYCACMAGDVWPICPVLKAPTCNCAGKLAGDPTSADLPLCTKPFVACPCDPADATCMKRCDAANPEVACPKGAYVTKPGLQLNKPCSGYHPVDNSLITSSFGCNYCPGVDRQTIRGSHGERCQGYQWNGALAKGRLRHCAVKPQGRFTFD